MLLNEYAITPDVFDDDCCIEKAAHRAYFQIFQNHLFYEPALVRDLCNGGWDRYVFKHFGEVSIKTKELIKKLKTQNRLRKAITAKIESPVNYFEWWKEANHSNELEPLTGIITSAELARKVKKKKAKSISIEKLGTAQWWKNNDPEIEVVRNINEYLKHLKIILAHAKSIIFIDPYLDPRQNHYKPFEKILLSIRRSSDPPLIQIHRKYLDVYARNEEDRKFKWEDIFRKAYSDLLRKAGLSIEVVIWGNFHDRYLLTDFIGIGLGKGFDTDNTITSWSRTGRGRLDTLFKYYNPDSDDGPYALVHRFKIP